MVTSVESNLALQAFGDGQWRPPIVRTEATTGKGVAELLTTVRAFRAHSAQQRQQRLAARQEYRLRELLARRFLAHVESQVLGAGEFDALIGRIARREVDPYTAAADILARALGAGEGTR
jgi:LAO/AO transport system kinase